MIRRTFILLSLGAAVLAAQAASAPPSTQGYIRPKANVDFLQPVLAAPKSAAPKVVSEVRKHKNATIRIADARVGRGLVPPPPPDTPSLMSAPLGRGGFTPTYMQQQYSPLEFLSPDALKERHAQLSAQLQKAKIDVKDKQLAINERAERAKQFEGLFNEGVISRRELEFAQSESRNSVGELEEAKSKVQDIQYGLARVNEKLKALSKIGIHPKSPVVSKGAKAKKSVKAIVAEKKVSAAASSTLNMTVAVPKSAGTTAETIAKPAPSLSSSVSTSTAPAIVEKAAPQNVEKLQAKPAPNLLDSHVQTAPVNAPVKLPPVQTGAIE